MAAVPWQGQQHLWAAVDPLAVGACSGLSLPAKVVLPSLF
jgi:hypothetical protein